jgi:hypothetical protein
VLTATLNWRLDVTSFGTIRSEEAAARLARVREGIARESALDQIHESWSRISNGIVKSRAARAEALASNDRAPFDRKWSATNRDSSPASKPRKHGRWYWPTAIPVARLPQIRQLSNPRADHNSHKDASRIRD